LGLPTHVERATADPALFGLFPAIAKQGWAMDAAFLARLREELYNATVVGRIDCHPHLRILRVRPDAGVFSFKPGQYVTLGMGLFEPRIHGAPPEEMKTGQERNLIRRAYSLSHPILAEDTGHLLSPDQVEFLEFYVTLVDSGNPSKVLPGLTPRLWLLEYGDRLYCAPRPSGHYTLDPVGPNDNLLFAATGTGEAPHNAMIWDLLRRGHRGRIVSAVCVRRRQDLAYREKHEALERRFSNYRYLTLTTREPTDAGRKVYLQEFVCSGRLEAEVGWRLDPQRTHAFLCGNPAMIGAPRTREGQRVYPEPLGMVEVLEARGFRADSRRHQVAGNIHFEEYW
jgi:ferredoxin--NADP+ reductase